MSTTKSIMLTDENAPAEFTLVREFADTLGVTPTTALKMFIRDRLPRRISDELMRQKEAEGEIETGEV